MSRLRELLSYTRRTNLLRLSWLRPQTDRKTNRMGRAWSRSSQIEPLEPVCLLAADVSLTRDIQLDLTPVPGYAVSPFQINGRVLFGSDSAETGLELWATDGTAGGTYLVKDIKPGPQDSLPQQFINFNGSAYFSIRDGSVWKTDGTEAGTVLVKASEGARIPHFAELNGSLYFNAGDSIWKTDGTTTTRVKDSFYITDNLLNVDGTLYFVATAKDRNGFGLWKSDGTEAGTVHVTDVYPASSPTELTPLADGTILFAGYSFPNFQLWKTDGTSEGTELVFTGTSGETPTDFVSYHGVVYFSATDGSGRELWKTDGTTAGTVRVADIEPGPTSSSPSELIVVNDAIYFFATTTTAGRELWTSDGTSAGTKQVTDILSGTNAFLPPSELTSLNGVLFFLANRDGLPGYQELWRSDGTSQGTYAISDFPVSESIGYPYRIIPAGDKVFLQTTSNRLWTSNGTLEGTTELLKRRTLDLEIWFKTSIQGTLYFMVNTEKYRGLWRSDGTEAGTVQVRAFESLVSKDFTVINDILYFAASDGTSGTELWRSDGSTAGTQLVTDLVPGPAGSSPSSLKNFRSSVLFWSGGLWTMDTNTNQAQRITKPQSTLIGSLEFNDRLFFVESNFTIPPYLNPLWITDGTFEGNVSLGGGSVIDYSLTRAGNYVYFVAHDALQNYSVWRTDGTAAGTYPIMYTPIGRWGNFIPSIIGSLDNKVFIQDGADETLWVSDGGNVEFLHSFPIRLRPQTMTVGNRIFFASTDEDTGLWMSDGTSAGTAAVTNAQGNSFQKVMLLGVLEGQLYFSVAANGRQTIWQTDGTPGGTKPVTDVQNMSFADLAVLKRADDAIYLRADDGIHGSEPWIIRSNETHLLADIWPGYLGSQPMEVEPAGDLVFVLASDEIHGQEFFVVGQTSQDVDDRNEDGRVDVLDLNLLCAAVAAGTTTREEVASFWQRQRTGPGDVNFDHQFESSDLVEVFQRAKYETGANAVWSDGDWNCDGIFDSSDLIAAFQSGWYEQGPRAAVSEDL